MDFNKENDQFEKEQSRVVKICLIKYKCILGGLVLLFGVIQIVILAVLSKEDIKITSLFNSFQSYMRNISNKNV